MRRRVSRWVALVTCGPAVSWVAAAELPEVATARELALRLIQDTRELLQVEVQARGPAGALEQCSRIALSLAMRHEQAGWRVRRVSERFRNPADRPDAYESAVLARFEAWKARGVLAADTEVAEVVAEGGRRYLRYMRPIIVGSPVCLSCHGEPREILPEVMAALQHRYPGDRATGYRLGDLRGAVSVRILLAPEREE